MTAWQRLILKSSLAVATAWQHLNNQIGGDITIIVGGKRTANIIQTLSANVSYDMTASVSMATLTANKPQSLSANINSTRQAVICQ